MPPGEDNRSSQAGPPPHIPAARLGKKVLFPRQAQPLPGKMLVFPRPIPPTLTPLPPSLPLLWKMPIFPRLLPPFPPSLTPFQPPHIPAARLGKTALFPRQVQPLPGKMLVSPRSVHPLPPFPPSPLLSCLHRKTGELLTSLTPKQVNPTIQQTILGKVAGIPQGKAPQASQEVQTTSQEGNNSTNPPARHPQGSSKEEPNPKWVINLSNKPLTPAQRSVLAKGPNFVVTPRQPPNLEYITAIEAACTKLSQQDAEELRANINRVLRSSHPPKPNLTKNQMSALRELKKDRDRIVLTADKGVAMVVMDRQDYINKAKHLLNQNTYKTITKDPTNTIKNKLINILKTIKTKSGLGTNIYKSMYPTGCVPPKFYGLPKIHKPDTPLRPIVSSCGSVTYGVAKELAKILKPLVGQSPHHINSTQDFVEQAKHFKLESGECLSSYDVSALFTSVPIDPALQIIKDLLVKDNTLKERTVMDVEDIILLLEFCLKNTYFSFQGQFYEQVEGAAMGSPVSPIVANLYMEYLEQKALSTAPHPPQVLGQVCG